MTLGHSLATLRQAWQRRPAAERLRLGIGGGISLALAGYLLLQRIDLPTWQGVEPPRLDTYLLDALPPITAMEADDWRQAGLRHSLVLDTIESDDGGWQLAGSEVTPSKAAQAIVQQSGGQNERRKISQALDCQAQIRRGHGYLQRQDHRS